MSFVVAVCSMKGGVGKTTTAVQLAAAFAELSGSRVLLGDLDGQGALATYFGLERRQWTMTELLLGECGLAEARVQLRPDLYLVPADARLYGLETALVTSDRPESRLGEALAGERYGYVVLDTPPNINWAMLNALYAADALLIPVTLEGLPLEALGQYVALVEATIRRGELRARVCGVVPTFYEGRTKLRQANHARLRETLPGLVLPPIHQSVKVPEAEDASATIFEHAPTSRVAEDYAELAKEVLRWRHARSSPAPWTVSRPTQPSSTR